MKVLHYITDMTSASGPVGSVVRMMIASTAKAAESHLVTCVPLGEETEQLLKMQYGVTMHYVAHPNGKNPVQLFRAYNTVKKVLCEVKPDVVHTHGTWSLMAAVVEKTARKRSIPTVVSPHRGFSADIIGIDFWKKKLPRLIAYQIMMMRNCTCVMAINEKEKNDILALAIKKRIETLSGIPKDMESVGGMRDEILAAYRKALDSTYDKRITQDEKDFVMLAVKKAVSDDDVEVDIPSVEGLSFRNIFFYAYDEDCTELMLQGGNKLNVPIPPTLQVSDIPRYVNKKAKKRCSINELPLSKSVKIEESLSLEKIAVEQICKSHGLGFEQMTIRQYVELYRLLRHTDFNEDVVAKELKRLKLLSFTKKMQRRLAIMYGLKPGYNIL